MIVYVKHQGGRLVRKGRTIQVKKEGDVLQTVFIHRLEQLVLMGHVELTPQVINLLCREQVPTVFLTVNGRYKGMLQPEESKNVFLRQKQFRSLDDSAFVLNTVRAIVIGKLSNMATLLGRIKRRNQQLNKNDFETKVDSIRQLIPEVDRANSVDSIRGYEGRGTAVFFEGFRYGFKEDFNFRKRVRRPPTDPINSVLSLLYTVLFNRMVAAVRAAYLDPAVGYLHTLDYGRHSLVLDLIEEFRSIVVETCTLSLFNLRILNHDSFVIEPLPEPAAEEETRKPSVKQDSIGHIFENPDDGFFDAAEQQIGHSAVPDHEPNEKRPYRLRPDALTAVLNTFEEKMTTEFQHPLIGEKITYAEALMVQAKHFREYLEGTYARYQPLQMK
jgi:CRISPR-associated protein Cas1